MGLHDFEGTSLVDWCTLTHESYWAAGFDAHAAFFANDEQLRLDIARNWLNRHTSHAIGPLARSAPHELFALVESAPPGKFERFMRRGHGYDAHLAREGVLQLLKLPARDVGLAFEAAAILSDEAQCALDIAHGVREAMRKTSARSTVDLLYGHRLPHVPDLPFLRASAASAMGACSSARPHTRCSGPSTVTPCRSSTSR
ncbi:hypothetical protein EON77_04005 [bacterium]|nr:MAG: hypothetical protein EON77_04005 [bacterium]